MKQKIFFLFFIFSSIIAIAQEKKQIQKEPAYKAMMEDYSINFYTVCDSAEAYFKTIDRFKKGSGYKPFMRWKYLNESKFGPSGNRNLYFYLPYKESQRIKSEDIARRGNKKSSSSMSWNYEGPDQVGTVTGHWAPGLGQFIFVKVNPSNKNQIYAGSRSGGLWRTNDEGLTWSHNTDNLPAAGVNCFDTNPSNFNDLIFNVKSGELSISFGIYRSTDGGNTFAQTAFNPTNLGLGGVGSNFQIYAIKYHPTIPNLIFIGTNHGIYRSTDNLNTWTNIIPSSSVYDIEFHKTNPNILYLYDSNNPNKNRILKSTDLGLSFVQLPEITTNNNYRFNISTIASNPSNIYLFSETGFWKSTDEGATFSLVSSSTSENNLYDGVPNDLDPTKFLAGYVDLCRSTDSGANFQKCSWWDISASANGSGSLQDNYNNSNKYVHADTNYKMCINGIFYVCTDGLLCKSEDNGATWQRLTKNIGNREYYNLGVNQSNVNATVLGCQDNGTTFKNDDGWYEVAGADGMECFTFPLNEKNMIFSTQSGGRSRTYNLGYNNTGIRPPGSTGEWVAPMFFDPNDQYTIYSFSQKVYKSTDFGSNWVELASPTTFTGDIAEAAIAENDSKRIAISRQNHLELSIDGGNSFTSIMGNLPSNLYISDVTFDPDNDNTLLVTYADVSSVYGQNKVFISTNSGASWSNITYNLGYLPVHNVIVAKGIIYIGTEIGVYYKNLTDTFWTPLNSGLPNVAVRELDFNYGANVLKAATWGRGLWNIKLVGRENYPSINKTIITDPVTFDTPKATVDQYVTSTIDYAGTLSNVYVSWAIGAPNFNTTDVIQMSLVSGNTWKSNSPLPSNQPSGTRIFFKVTAVGSSGDTSETYKFMYELKPYQYCASAGESDNGNLFIKRFQLSNLDNNNTANDHYTYYNTTPIILFKGDTYKATGTFNYSFANSDDFYVWIDYNKNAVFETNENVVANANNVPGGNDAISSGTFTIPANTPTSEVRLRARYGYWSGFDNPCGTSLGEVEDYLVKIIDKPTISFTKNNIYCLNENVTLNYTGSTVQNVSWELTNGINTYNFTGNTVSTNTLPAGDYTVTVIFRVEDNDFKQVFNNSFKITPNPTNVDIHNNNETICNNQIRTLTTSGGLVIGNKSSKVSEAFVGKVIPDSNANTGVTEILTVNNVPSGATITKVDVKLNLNHGGSEDIIVNLEAPNGKIINLYNRNAGWWITDPFTNIIFTSDASAAALTNSSYTGTFKANLANETTAVTTPLVNSINFADVFSSPNGDWKIHIYDVNRWWITGSVKDWSIVLTYDSNEIVWSPATDLYTDAACTIPYVLGNSATTVYTKPNATVTYTAIAKPESCSNTDSVTYTIDCSTLGTDNNNPNKIVIYPNPVKHGETLMIKGLTGENTIRIFDTSGKLLLRKNITNNLITIPNSITAGNYILEIAGNDNKQTKTTIKLMIK